MLQSSIDKRAKMNYTTLGEAKIDDSDQLSMYAVIIDAGHPYKHQQN